MQTIFITGASSGLGKAAAKLFQNKGWQVIATMRNPENETELSKLKNVIVLPLDVTDVERINLTVKEVTEKYTIDAVLNNAGYGLIGPLEGLTDEQIVRQLDTNLLGVIRISKAFSPHFRRNGQGIFLNVTSIFGLIGFPTCTIYCASKFAIDGFSESLSYEMAQFGVKVKIIAPGGIKTDFATRSMDGGQHEAYQQLVAEVSKGYSAEKLASYTEVGDIARVLYEAATDGKNQLRYVAGNDAITLYNERNSPGAEAQFHRIKATFTL